MPYFGTPLFAAPGLGILPSATILGLGPWWLRAIEARARRVAEAYSSETEATVDEQFVRERATNADNFHPAELLHGHRSEHLRQHRTSGQAYCGQVDHDDCIPALDWEFVHWRNTLDARVVDEHIDASEFARRMLDQPRGVGWLGEIAKGHRTPWAAAMSLRSFPIAAASAEAVDHDIGAHGGKRAQSGVESLVVPVTTATLPFNMK